MKNIIEPILAGQTLPDTLADDRQYLIDLGLLRRDPRGGLVISNPIYREVIPRVLFQGTQDSLPLISPSWPNYTGSDSCPDVEFPTLATLQDQTLISILRQLRDGFPKRPENFPSSVGLIGLYLN